jgi:hypothetical protein
MSHCVCSNYWHHITEQYDQLEFCKLPEKWGSWLRQDRFCLWIVVETSWTINRTEVAKQTKQTFMCILGVMKQLWRHLQYKHGLFSVHWNAILHVLKLIWRHACYKYDLWYVLVYLNAVLGVLKLLEIYLWYKYDLCCVCVHLNAVLNVLKMLSSTHLQYKYDLQHRSVCLSTTLIVLKVL